MEVFRMIKFKQGWIGTKEGVKKDIIVKAAAPNKLKDALIGGSFVIGGIIYLTSTAFRYGSKKHEDAEIKAMEDLNLLKDID